jgi:hypothetical protein
MAKDCCGSGMVNTLLVSGDGIKVTGSGTSANPYVVESDLPDFSRSISVLDTETVNLTIWGSGTPGDPFRIQADSSMTLTGLSDIADPQGGPSAGEVPTWVLVNGEGHWEFQTPPPAPAGAVNVGEGLGGVGSVLAPIYVKVSGIWGTAPLNNLGPDSTIGLPVYADSEGALRAWATTAAAVGWSSITGKPTTFTPSTHKHLAAEITDPQNLDVGRVNGIKVYWTSKNASAPLIAQGPPQKGDLWFTY